MAVNPAEEIACNFFSRGSFGVPTETEAYEKGIVSREERGKDSCLARDWRRLWVGILSDCCCMEILKMFGR